MYKILLAEDVEFEQKNAAKFIERYAQETGLEIELTIFDNGAELLRQYPPQADVLLLDIAMPGVDGLTAARRIRRQDPNVIIIFISSMVQYAIQGYSVEAMDFIVKPVSYTALRLRLDRAFARIAQSRPRDLEIRSEGSLIRVNVAEIAYAETYHHRIMIHTRGQKLPTEMSMRELEAAVRGFPFFRCHTSYLVNLRFVDKVQGNAVEVGGTPLAISRYRRKEFLEAWAAFLGDGV